MTSQTALSQWNALNSRQQKYLALIFKIDQDSEKTEKQSWFKGEERRPASEWRWMFYGDLNFIESRLKSLLRDAGYVDPGTGSTFKALERRGLIECEGEVPELQIKITKLGRQVIRAGTNKPTKSRPKTPKGMLTQKAWQAISEAFQQNDVWVPPSILSRLTEHNPPLVTGSKTLHLTTCGHLFYIRNYQQYREIYPDIDAPIPSQTEAEFMSELEAPEGDKSALARVKRWGRGMKETAAEIGAIRPSELFRFEKGQPVNPEKREQILSWLKR
ncbi:MAG: hypothetical protein AAFO06_24410 [Cyanobacteria bacterium J06597_16]